MAATLSRAWSARGPLACALWPVSLLFGALAALRRALFRTGLMASQRLPVPVVVVGNIFIGGTGKTPFTIWLVQTLRAAGFHPGVISRGHGGEGAVQPVGADANPQQVGDEPLLIALRAQCPVMVGRERAAAGCALLAAHPEVDLIISDDCLQHYALQRDVEIILFDTRGAGNGWLLPAGPLREPVSRRRDFTIVNGAELPGGIGGTPYRMQLAGQVAERLLRRDEQIALSALAAQPATRIVAAAGIGNPGRFFAMLRAAGLRFDELALPDHHDFLDQPFARLDADVILITEKDAVKCAQIEQLKNDPRLWVVPVSAQLDAALAEHIVEKCRGRSPA
ncbi:MAG: tetraacyldisaccharide 4'-kinase [Massilia sp.]